ncbi:hypothetical protein EV132_111143 [Rhizobium sullae]|uniref:Uncharacterized protein n=1 Tax=Rhizobium sullae TaxID=50338 RepID=A0A4R3PYG3_RHISU|nr:hypothetical protein EV132_111143 [Rhizobium sullae]
MSVRGAFTLQFQCGYQTFIYPFAISAPEKEMMYAFWCHRVETPLAQLLKINGDGHPRCNLHMGEILVIPLDTFKVTPKVQLDKGFVWVVQQFVRKLTDDAV